LRADYIFFRGILANFHVCLAVLMAYAAKSPSGKFIACLLPISVFVLGGYEHSIANMAIFSISTMHDCTGLRPETTNPDGSFKHGMFWLNLLMSTLGNILGGWLLGIPYYLVHLWHTKHVLEHVPTSDQIHSIDAPDTTLASAQVVTGNSTCPVATTNEPFADVDANANVPPAAAQEEMRKL